MTGPGFHPEAAAPFLLSGTAGARGRGQVLHPRADAAQIRAATIGRVESARADGVIDSEVEAFLAAQRSFHETHDPDGMAELAGIASAFDLPLDGVFAHLHLGTLQDLKGGGRLADGCSAWAVPDADSGPMAVKNRDYSGTHLGIQSVAYHTGPDIETGGWLAVGSLGSPGAYSSGMNAAGLALVDTQVAVRTHRVGWLRYFLMSRILSRCASVPQALDFIASVPHAGGGTLVMADRDGAIAAVELDAKAHMVTTGPVVWRTNHYVLPGCAEETLAPGSDRIAQNSADRFRFLGNALPGRVWSRRAAATLMATHPNSAEGAAPLCQHAEGQQSQTLSTSIYSCRLGTLTFCDGNPCTGRWFEFKLPH